MEILLLWFLESNIFATAPFTTYKIPQRIVALYLLVNEFNQEVHGFCVFPSHDERSQPVLLILSGFIEHIQFPGCIAYNVHLVADHGNSLSLGEGNLIFVQNNAASGAF